MCLDYFGQGVSLEYLHIPRFVGYFGPHYVSYCIHSARLTAFNNRMQMCSSTEETPSPMTNRKDGLLAPLFNITIFSF